MQTIYLQMKQIDLTAILTADRKTQENELKIFLIFNFNILYGIKTSKL